MKLINTFKQKAVGKLYLILLMVFCFATLVKAEVKLPAIFSGHMVLQADAAISFWGWADAGENVTVSFNSKSVSTVADKDGKWKVKIGPFKSSLTPSTVEVQGKNKITIKDVLVGEVWICGGQSNMQLEVRSNLNPEVEIPAANYPAIRQFRFPRTMIAEGPSATMPAAEWKVCTPQNVGNFSGVAYFFARSLFTKLSTPVGLVNVSVGGTPVEAWMSAEVMDNPAFAPVHERWEMLMKGYPEKKKKFDVDFENWKKADAEAKAKGATPPKKPTAPVGPGHPTTPTGLYNGMIAPILPLTFKGIIWYQGEANAVRWETYGAMFRTMIVQWRKDFKRSDAPFYFVQLANFKAPAAEQKNYAWQREQQASALALPNTAMVVASDVGDPNDIHFKNKQAVGKRMALIALNKLYGGTDEYSGPVYQSQAIKGDKIELSFSNAKGLALRNKGTGLSFEIAGNDKVFYAATASISADGKVVVSAPEVKNPVAIRYAWDNVPDMILYNGAGLPASSFRTDNWEAYK